MDILLFPVPRSLFPLMIILRIHLSALRQFADSQKIDLSKILNTLY